MIHGNAISHHLLTKDATSGWIINDQPAPRPCTTLQELIAMLHQVQGPNMPGLIQQGLAAAVPEAEA
jgi:hypothetical protein